MVAVKRSSEEGDETKTKPPSKRKAIREKHHQDGKGIFPKRTSSFLFSHIAFYRIVSSFILTWPFNQDLLLLLAQTHNTICGGSRWQAVYFDNALYRKDSLRFIFFLLCEFSSQRDKNKYNLLSSFNL